MWDDHSLFGTLPGNTFLWIITQPIKLWVFCPTSLSSNEYVCCCLPCLPLNIDTGGIFFDFCVPILWVPCFGYCPQSQSSFWKQDTIILEQTWIWMFHYGKERKCLFVFKKKTSCQVNHDHGNNHGFDIQAIAFVEIWHMSYSKQTQALDIQILPIPLCSRCLLGLFLT